MLELSTERLFELRRTNELSVTEKRAFLDLFERTFRKTMTVYEFDRKYSITPLGYSYHGFMVIDGTLAGAYNIIPYRYAYFGASRLFGLCVDTMVDASYRGGPFNVLKMAAPVHEAAAEDGVAFLLDFPNENAAEFTKKILRWKEIGELEFYALPLTVGPIYRWLRWGDPISRGIASLIVRLPRRRGPTHPGSAIEKVADAQFDSHRYGPAHRRVALRDGGSCVYRLCREENGMRVLYVIDVLPLTPRSFARAVRAIHRAASREADLILYVGRLPFSPPGLTKVPVSRRPRRMLFCGKVLKPDLVDDRVFDIGHWNINVSNFDVR